jgi:hypothetical protein
MESNGSFSCGTLAYAADHEINDFDAKGRELETHDFGDAGRGRSGRVVCACEKKRYTGE